MASSKSGLDSERQGILNSFSTFNGEKTAASKVNVFGISEEHAHVRSRHRYDEDKDYSDFAGASKGKGNFNQNKPKLTVEQAAMMIHATDLTAFLATSSREAPLMRFASYFKRAFSAVPLYQFSWVDLFRNHLSTNLSDVPISYISRSFCRASTTWIRQQPVEELSGFILWCFKTIVADLNRQASSRILGMFDLSLKSQVDIFAALAMVLRGMPDAFVDVLPTLRETLECQDQDLLSVVAWMIAQVAEGDLIVGLYSWAHILLPFLNEDSFNPSLTNSFNPSLIYNILEIIERILSSHNDKSIFKSGTLKNGEPLIPPSSLEILLRVTFSSSSARAYSTDGFDFLVTRQRFQKLYPVLKGVALAGSKPMKELAESILRFAITVAGENNHTLSMRAAELFTCCLSQDVDFYQLWDTIYLENLKASAVILKVISGDWDNLRVELAPLDPLLETLRSFRHQNEAEIASRRQTALIQEVDQHCVAILKKSAGNQCSSKGLICFFTAFVVIVAMIAPNMEWDSVIGQLKSQFP